MTGIALPALRGRNPLGLFAALGALDVATRSLPDKRVTLRWTEGLEPCAVLCGPDDVDHLVSLCHADLARWESSPILTWGPDGTPLDDLKPEPDHLTAWTAAVLEDAARTRERVDVDLFNALVAEGAKDRKGATKPTAFHFTFGNQKFLAIVRKLRGGIDSDDLREALVGPWRFDSALPTLRWDLRIERIYALRGFNPQDERNPGVPGADWLGFLGLRFFPVASRRGGLLTTACAGPWKRETFTWPLWHVDLTSLVAASLLADTQVVSMNAADRRQLGVHEVLRAPIRRPETAGYGNFGAPEPVSGSATSLSR